jgi:hypothetical protein
MNKIFLTLAISALIMTGCNLKVNLNTNGSTVETSNTNASQNTNQPVAETNTNSDQLVANNKINFTFELNDEKMITKVVNKDSGEVWISDIKALCGNEMMIYAHPVDSMKVILSQFNPGSDKPVRSLYLLYLQNKTCTKLEVSKDLADFGARVLSPDQTKLAVALETNEAKELKVLDLIADQSGILVTLEDGETLNGGYGSLSNKFDINWQGDDKIQYTVYEDTVKNYPDNLPDVAEKVKEVRIINL